INTTQATQSYNQSLSQVTTLAQQIIAPTSGNDLTSSLQSLFNAFTNLSATPQDPTVRATVINAASNFAQLAQSTSTSLQSTASNELSQLPTLVQQVNEISGQIATLNGQIGAAQAGDQAAAALQDQRDGLVNQLATLIGAGADSNGNVSVGGVPLVEGGNALPLSTTGAGTSIQLQVSLPAGTLPIQMDQVGGQIGGVLAGASAVTNLMSQVNNFATAAADAFNQQSQAGFGLDGSTNNAIFVVGGANNPIAINPALTVQNLPAAASAAGVPGDGSNATALAALANNPNLIGSFPNQTLGQAYTQIESNFGITVQNATNSEQQASSSLQSLTSLKGSITGVSINDQLTNLVEYQNMLQATGRAVQAANDMTTFLIQELNQ
ncbi:MAG TPA: flagellar hook-associated protein FlgK, partial [Candidatus Binataceae bacterium]|nr:flagellar hook-associated protein FlgK [Candidatus Binataceae bacterium]